MKSIGAIQETSLKSVFRQLNAIRQIERKVLPYLPEELRPYCRVANYEYGALKFAVATGVWGAKLRYLLPALLTKLRQEAKLPQIASINFYVEPAFETLFKK